MARMGGGRGVDTLIEQMRATAPPGQRVLDASSASRLTELTAALLADRRVQAVAEHERFLSVLKREICLPYERLTDRLGGAVILVTGGTGCVGTHLVGQLAAYRPARIVSVSRGLLRDWPRHPAVEYVYADVGSRAQIEELISEVRPDLIFHLASQHLPGLAETQVWDTVTTNLLGTRNVLAAAAEAGVGHVVFASTGKALRPFSPDIYAASKRVAEWVEHCFAASGTLSCSAVRFTHVVDNSDIHKRLIAWASSSAVVRLHSPQIMFYVQSATECAQLLLLASLDACPGELRIHSISDLGWPVSLLDLALGVLASHGSDAPVYFSGYDPGYEDVAFPGLYDPMTAGDVSPLINAFEAAAIVESPDSPMTDTFVAAMAAEPRAANLLAHLEDTCAQTTDPAAVRAALQELSWSVLDASLRAVPHPMLARIARLVERHSASLTPDHQRILQAIHERERITAGVSQVSG